MNTTETPHGSWTDIEIELDRKDVKRIKRGGKIRMLVRPYGTECLVAGPEIVEPVSAGAFEVWATDLNWDD